MQSRSIMSATLVLLLAMSQLPILAKSTPSQRNPFSIASVAQDNSLPILTEKAIEGEIVGAECRSYQVEVGANQYARIAIDPRGISFKLRLVAPDGTLVFETLLPEGMFDRERVSIIAENAGTYRLELTALSKSKTALRFAVGLEELRPAKPIDQRRIEAERQTETARSTLAGRTAEALTGGLDKYSSALETWRALGEGREQADILLAMGRISHNLSRTMDALRYYDQSLTIWRSLGDRPKEAQTLSAIGWTYASRGDAETALTYYKQALPIRREIHDMRGQAQTLTTIGQAYAAIGEPQKAISYYTDSLPMAREAGDSIQEAFALNNFTLLYAHLGEYQKALDSADQALPLWKKTGQKYGEAQALNGKGVVFEELGDFEKAISYYERSIAISRPIGDRNSEADTLNNIGNCYWALGQSPRDPDLLHKSIDYLNQALAIRQAIGHKQHAGDVLNSLGLVYQALGEPDKALDYFREALAADPRSRSAVHNIGLNYYYRNDYQRAIEYCTQSLEKFHEARDARGEARSLRVVALSQMHLGNLDEALSKSEAALAIVESGRSKTSGAQARTSFDAVNVNFYSLQTRLLYLMHLKHPSAGYEARALEITERGRARGLLDLLSDARVDIHEGVDTALLDREKVVESELNAKEQYRMRLLGSKPTEGQKAAVEKEIATLIHEYQELRDQIRSSSPRYASLTQPTPLGAKEIQKLLDDDTIILDYWMTAESPFLWLISSTSVSMHSLPPGNSIFSAARRVYELMTARNQHPPDETADQRVARLAKADSEFRSSAAALSQMVLGPVASKLGHKRLVIIADSTLQYIPFGALPAPQPAGTISEQTAGDGAAKTRGPPNSSPLIADHEIVYLPSASVLGALRELSSREHPPGGVAIIADPVFALEDPRTSSRSRGSSSDALTPSSHRYDIDAWLPSSANGPGVSVFRRLRFSRNEADEIASLAGSAKSLKMLDFAANKDAVTSATLSQYGILHVATHTLLNSQRPELSGVVLSLVDENGNPRDGFLRLHEIFNLKLNASLVVLSACNTALGTEVRGEGLVGLTRGFMHAGAPRVAASLWSVDDRATAELMKLFYKAMLVDGMRPASALRAAQIEMFARKGWNAPYFWAAFTLQGEWR